MKRPTEDQALELHELVSKSDMTLGELITSYRQAKNKSLQLHALAELTLLPEEQIKDLLLANGVRPEELPRKRAKKTPQEQPETEVQTTPPKNSEVGDVQPDSYLAKADHIVSEAQIAAKRLLQAVEALGQIIAEQADVIRRANGAVNTLAELLKGGPHDPNCLTYSFSVFVISSKTEWSREILF